MHSAEVEAGSSHTIAENVAWSSHKWAAGEALCEEQVVGAEIRPHYVLQTVTDDATPTDLACGVDASIAECGAVSKRVVDFLGSVALGVLASPFLIAAMLAIRCTSKGPILYKHTRIGRGNRPFVALKFRTMRVNADEGLQDFLENDLALREQWESVNKLKNDPRVTPVGRFLRRFSLDEVPQLWNVLIGDMSLIGPRPIVAAEVQRYGEDFATYARMRPGLTGLWQVSGRNDTTYQQRVDYDCYYIRNWSFGLDAKIFIKTFRAVISGVGAY